MSRSIIEVIEKLNKVTTNNNLKVEIDRISYDACFKAPEMVYQLWNALHFKLVEVYEHPFTSDEALEIFSIFTGRTKEELLEIKEQEKGHYD